MIPSWILDIFAAIMLVVAAVSAARLVAVRPWRHGARAALTDIDIAHLLMALAMAGMLVASLQTLPNGAWSVIFAAMTVWFGYRVFRDAQVSGVRALAGGHCAPHLIHAAAMLYMFMAFTAPAAHGSGGIGGMAGGMSGMGTLQLPILAFVFALLLIGYSIWDLDQLSGPGASGHYSFAATRMAPMGPVLVGAMAAGCRRRVRAGRPPGRFCRGGRGRARRGQRSGEPRRPGCPRAVGGDQLPDRYGRHHGVHAADHDLAVNRRSAPPRRTTISLSCTTILTSLPPPSTCSICRNAPSTTRQKRASPRRTGQFAGHG